MWQYGLMTSVISKFIIDKDRMDPEIQEKIQTATKQIKEYGEIAAGLDVHNPLTWVSTATSIINKFYDENSSEELQESFTSQFERILAEESLIKVGDFDLSQCFRTLRTFYKFKYIDIYNFNREDEDVGISLDSAYVDPGFYIFDVDGKTIGCLYSHQTDKTYYISDKYQNLTDLERDKVFMGMLKDISSKVWSTRSHMTLYSKVNVSGYTETCVDPFDASDYRYYGPLEKLKDRWPKYRAKGIRRTAIFQGRPGTGKTTLCYWLSNEISERTLVLDAYFLDEQNNREIESIIKFLSPSMVVINDIHCIDYVTLQGAFTLFEEGETGIDVPYIVCTSNDLSAIPEPLMRPGRLGDEAYVFEDMELSDRARREVIRAFEAKVDYTIPDYYRDTFIKAYTESDQTEAFFVEILKRASVEGDHIIEHFLKEWE